jgi:sialic acid synthase SpsE
MKIFAEIGLNHLGSSKKAIDLAKECLKQDIDGITLQIQPESYYDNSKKFRRALNIKTYQKISSMTKKRKKLFGLAIMDLKTLKKYEVVKTDFLKILSLAFDNTELIKKVINTKKKTYLSTGFSNLQSIIRIGKKHPNINFIHTSLNDKPKDANLSAIQTMKKKTKNKISFGLHSLDHEILLLSVFYSPDSIFFYIKPGKNDDYPDNEHAISLKNLSKILRLIKISKLSLGNGIKVKKKIPSWVFE